MTVDTGIGPIGKIGWGTHFCHFYKDADDLSETLVPFFKTGIDNNEACLWVTAEPFAKTQAWSALNTHVDRLDDRIAKGQIGIFDHAEWYERYGSASAKDVVSMWIDWETKALQAGYSGLRLTGNTAFLETETWDDFMDYENCLRDAFARQKLIALCSYDSGRCDADAVLDVVQAHDFALARRRGHWEVVESASVMKSKRALAELNAELETRIDHRTSELADALAHQRQLTAELSHRVKNSIASVQAIIDQTLQSGNSIISAREAIRNRLGALAQVHDQLAAVDWKSVGLSDILLAVLRPYSSKVRLVADGERLTPRAAMDLALVVNELATNAVKYGALSRNEGMVEIEVGYPSAADPVLSLTWKEVGGPYVPLPTREGFGTRLIRQIVSYNLRGDCELAFDRSGLTCTIRIPASEALAPRAGCVHGGPH
jgi:two-component system, sensor histidine kinase PdtaS